MFNKIVKKYRVFLNYQIFFFIISFIYYKYIIEKLFKKKYCMDLIK